MFSTNYFILFQFVFNKLNTNFCSLYFILYPAHQLDNNTSTSTTTIQQPRENESQSSSPPLQQSSLQNDNRRQNNNNTNNNGQRSTQGRYRTRQSTQGGTSASSSTSSTTTATTQTDIECQLNNLKSELQNTTIGGDVDTNYIVQLIDKARGILDTATKSNNEIIRGMVVSTQQLLLPLLNHSKQCVAGLHQQRMKPPQEDPSDNIFCGNNICTNRTTSLKNCPCCRRDLCTFNCFGDDNICQECIDAGKDDGEEEEEDSPLASKGRSKRTTG